MNNFHKIIFFIFFISFINAKEKYSIFISVSDLNQDPIKNAKVKLLDKNGKKVDNTKSNKSGNVRKRHKWTGNGLKYRKIHDLY